MPMLAKIDQTTVDAHIARHLPNTQNVSTADTLDEACDVVGRNIYPHRLRLAAPSGQGRTITLDAWVKDDALSKLSLDLAQFDDKNKLPAGTSLPLVLTFEQTGHTVEAPTSATPVDLTQLGSLLQAFSGQTG